MYLYIHITYVHIVYCRYIYIYHIQKHQKRQQGDQSHSNGPACVQRSSPALSPCLWQLLRMFATAIASALSLNLSSASPTLVFSTCNIIQPPNGPNGPHLELHGGIIAGVAVRTSLFQDFGLKKWPHWWMHHRNDEHLGMFLWDLSNKTLDALQPRNEHIENDTSWTSNHIDVTSNIVHPAICCNLLNQFVPKANRCLVCDPHSVQGKTHHDVVRRLWIQVLGSVWETQPIDRAYRCSYSMLQCSVPRNVSNFHVIQKLISSSKPRRLGLDHSALQMVDAPKIAWTLWVCKKKNRHRKSTHGISKREGRGWTGVQYRFDCVQIFKQKSCWSQHWAPMV